MNYIVPVIKLNGTPEILPKLAKNPKKSQNRYFQGIKRSGSHDSLNSVNSNSDNSTQNIIRFINGKSNLLFQT